MFQRVLRRLGLGLFFVNVFAFSVTPSIAQAANRESAFSTSIVASPSPGNVANHLSNVVSLSASDAWAVGGATSAVGHPAQLQTRPLIVRWDGATWRTVKSGVFGAAALSGIAAVTSHNIWAVGHQGPNEGGTPLIEHWNGSAWSVVPSPAILDGYLLGVSAVGADDIWAVGIRVGLVSYSLIEHWNGSRWRAVDSPNPGVEYNEIDSVVAIAHNNAWAVGFSISNNISRPLLSRWNGSRWSVVRSPATGMQNNLLRSVAAVSKDDVWAVGQSRSIDGSRVKTLVEHFDGRGWHVVPSPSPTPQTWLIGVAVHGDEVWAVGVRVDGFTTRTLMLHGEQGQLNAIATANRGGDGNMLEAVIASHGIVWAVGSNQAQTKGESLVLRARIE